MKRDERDELRPEIRKLRERIERWRGSRTKRSPMPEKLWAAATSLAQDHGAYRISQDLGVNYGSLRSRLEESGRDARGRRTQLRREPAGVAPNFVQLEAVPALAAPGLDGASVEVEDAAGSKLSIRVGATSTVDVCSVLAAFRGEGRRRRRR